jgi:isoleucyl-tRNA synthetase
VNPEIEYVKVATTSGANFIFAKEKLAELTKKFGVSSGGAAGAVLEGAEVVAEMRGDKLVGKKYRPIFNFFTGDGAMSAGKKIANPENGWKVYAAPYVTTEAGTGIVHLAPGYGEEDMELAKQFHIPFVLHVGPDGKFARELGAPLEDDNHTVLAGLRAKPKPTAEDPNLHQSSDILILKHLAKVGLLFAKEKIVHSYPHCHRCDTPLYYFALRAWFVAIQGAKKDMLAENEKNKLGAGAFETRPVWKGN